MAVSFQTNRVYPVDNTIIHWRGMEIVDPDEFALFMRGPVKDRVTDSQFETDLAHDLTALATTEMATSTLAALLNATQPPLDWEIGEAMSECLLSEEFRAPAFRR